MVFRDETAREIAVGGESGLELWADFIDSAMARQSILVGGGGATRRNRFLCTVLST